MRRLLLVPLLALSLGACAQLKGIETAVELGAASIANPVTKTRLNQMENASILVFSGLKTWKALCQNGTIAPACRDQIAVAQTYTRQIPPYLAQLRTFVKSNDQINAISVWNNVLDIIDTVKAQAAVGGVAIKTTLGA